MKMNGILAAIVVGIAALVGLFVEAEVTEDEGSRQTLESACVESTLLIAPRITTVEQSIAIPAGTYDISLESWDDHFNDGIDVFSDTPVRLDPTQPTEQYHVDFLSGGSVVASTGTTPDIPDDVERGETLYETVTLPSDVDTVRFVLDSTSGTPDSVYGRLCVTPASAPPTTTVPSTTTSTPETTTTVPDETTTTAPATTVPEATTTEPPAETTSTVPSTTETPTTVTPSVPPAPVPDPVPADPDFTG